MNLICSEKYHLPRILEKCTLLKMPSAKKHPYILPFFCTAQFTFNCILKDYLVIKACKEVEEQVSILLELEKYEW